MLQIGSLEFRVSDSVEGAPEEDDNIVPTLTAALNQLSEDRHQSSVSVCLHRRCDFVQLVFFAYHFVQFPSYRKLVSDTLESVLNDCQFSSRFSGALSTRARVIISFRLSPCDIITPIDKSWSATVFSSYALFLSNAFHFIGTRKFSNCLSSEWKSKKDSHGFRLLVAPSLRWAIAILIL